MLSWYDWYVPLAYINGMYSFDSDDEFIVSVLSIQASLSTLIYWSACSETNYSAQERNNQFEDVLGYLLGLIMTFLILVNVLRYINRRQ